MKRFVCVGVLLTVLSSVAFASAGPTQGRWKVLARATDSGSQVVAVGVGKSRATKFAVRARVTGEPKAVKVHAVVLCSKAGPLGVVTLSRSQRFTLTGSAMKELELPIANPENCGVTAIGISNAYKGRLTMQILAPCTVQRRGGCLA